MSKIKFTKGELKKQRDSLKQFRRYLPTLQLKKQQLQMKIVEIRRELLRKEMKLTESGNFIQQWSGLLAEPDVDIKPWSIPVNVVLSEMNIAGAKIPVLERIEFKEIDYDFYIMPFWVDKAIEELRAYMNLFVEVEIIKAQIDRLEHELRITTQRVNLFEKIKIPECIENIRMIRIYLGDQQANAVGISKVAKRKLEKVPAPEEVLV